MHHLNDQQISHLRGRLNREAEEIKSRIEGFSAEFSAPLQNDSDPIDQAQSNSERTALMADLRRSQLRLQKVGRALALEPEDIGVCMECGTDIPFARMDFDPAIDHCVDCQGNAENRKRMVG